MPNDTSVRSVWNMICPSCQQDDTLDVQTHVMVRITKDGTDVQESCDGSHEWDDNSKLLCASCGWTGTVNDAQIAHQQNPVHERNRKIAAECRRLGIQHAVRTRVDLMEIPAIANLGADSCGQPLAYENTYNCEDCDVSWTDHWSCGVDTPCPCCGQDTAPEDMQLRISTLLTPLFEMLPEIAAEEALT